MITKRKKIERMSLSWETYIKTAMDRQKAVETINRKSEWGKPNKEEKPEKVSCKIKIRVILIIIYGLIGIL